VTVRGEKKRRRETRRVEGVKKLSKFKRKVVRGRGLCENK